MKTEATDEGATLPSAGIEKEADCSSLGNLLNTLKQTTALSSSSVELDFGYYANVLNLGNNLGLAISTDGVGTKILIAQMMDKYDTIGIDCIAMNVNDILCVGAEPISMVDYIAVQNQDYKLLHELGKGLLEGAKQARISIPAGEIAQIKEMLKGEREGYGFDLVGTAVGTLPLDKIITGQAMNEGDILLGLRSSGIHSNGYTKTRQVLLAKGRYTINSHIDELGKTLGEELLEPTHIYVPEIMEIIQSGIKIKALAHITGDGLLNLSRIGSDCGFIIENYPEPLPIFNLIQKAGSVSDEEMFETYNMGIGFCIVVPGNDVKNVFEICKKYKIECYRLGYVVKDTEKKVRIEDRMLISKNKKFEKYS